MDPSTKTQECRNPSEHFVRSRSCYRYKQSRKVRAHVDIERFKHKIDFRSRGGAIDEWVHVVTSWFGQLPIRRRRNKKKELYKLNHFHNGQFKKICRMRNFGQMAIIALDIARSRMLLHRLKKWEHATPWLVHLLIKNKKLRG